MLTTLLLDHLIEKIYAGPKNSFLVTQNKEVLAFGLNRDEQLGFKGEAYLPTKLDLKDQVEYVRPGFRHTLFKIFGSDCFIAAGSNKQ